jgi:hypothetical protein
VITAKEHCKAKKMKMTRTVVLLFFMLPILTAQTKRAQPDGILDVRQMMSAAEFNQAGLNKLTTDEVAALNQWLYSYSLKLRANTSESTAERTATVIESHIEGDFEGWSGDTIFKLDNGQIWQQDLYAYKYHYAYHPKMLIYKDGGRYKMKVDGVEESIVVKRIK